MNIQRKHIMPVNSPFLKKGLAAILVCAALLLTMNHAWAQTAAVTSQNLRDAILEKTAFTNTELQAMDLNKDGKVDVADLVLFYININALPNYTRYLGTMTFDPASALAPQNMELTLPNADPGTVVDATFNPQSSSPFFSAPFTMKAAYSAAGGIQFSSEGSGVFASGDKRNPLQQQISWKLNISEAILNGGALQAKFTMTYTGFKPDGQPLTVSGDLYLAKDSDFRVSFINAANWQLMNNLYGVK